METSRARILQFIDYKKLEPKKFLEKTGLKKGFVDKTHINSGASDLYLSKILAVFPEINPEWLLTGRGEMLRSVEPKKEETGTVKSRLKEFLQYKHLSVLAFEKSINASNGYVSSISKGIGINYIKKIQETYKDLNINWLLYGEGDMIDGNNQVNNGVINGVNVQQQNGGSIKVGQDKETETYKILLAEKDKQIVEYKNQIAEYKNQITEKDRQLSEKDKIINKILETFSKRQTL